MVGMDSFSAQNPRPQTTQDGDVSVEPGNDGLGMLLECVRSAWKGPEGAASCARRFLADVEGVEQTEQLGRLLSFIEAVRGPLLERLQGHDERHWGDGSMEEASRKRGRRDTASDDKEGHGEPEDTRGTRAKAEARHAFPGPSGTTAAAQLPAAAQEGMSRAAKGVLLDQDLLGCVWGFVLGGHGRQHVRVLGQWSLVCRKWREAGAWDGWWRAIEEDMLPLLRGKEERGKAESSRDRVVEYGRFLEGEKDPLVSQDQGDSWLEGLEGHVEVFDRMDGLQMLSMRGPVSLSDEYSDIALKFRAESPETQVKAAAFSAASRDPLRRFSTMEEYLRNGHGEEYPCCFCMRVTVRDTRTGKMAVIWEESKQRLEWVGPSDNEGEILAYGGGWRRRDARFGRLLHLGVVFFDLRCVSDQGEGVSEPHVLYRINPTLEVNLRALDDDQPGEGILGLKQFEGILRAVLG